MNGRALRKFAELELTVYLMSRSGEEKERRFYESVLRKHREYLSRQKEVPLITLARQIYKEVVNEEEKKISASLELKCKDCANMPITADGSAMINYCAALKKDIIGNMAAGCSTYSERQNFRLFRIKENDAVAYLATIKEFLDGKMRMLKEWEA